MSKSQQRKGRAGELELAHLLQDHGYPVEPVLGYCPDEIPLPIVHEVYMDGAGQWTSAQVYGIGKVTHWMPMPEPESRLSAVCL